MFKKSVYIIMMFLLVLPLCFSGCFGDEEKKENNDDLDVNNYAWLAIMNLDSDDNITGITLTANNEPSTTEKVYSDTLDYEEGLILQIYQSLSLDIVIEYNNSINYNINDESVTIGRVKEIDWTSEGYDSYDDPASEWEDILTDLYGKSITKNSKIINYPSRTLK